jgi:predicted lactoylglutathione lyase
MAQESWWVAPFFNVRSVVASANYYRDKLGFHFDRFWNEPPSFCMVKRGGIIIMLSQNDQPAAIRPNRLVDPEEGAWDAYVWVDDADKLFAEYQSRGVKIVRPPCDQVYKCRDFEADDLDGYRLCFGHTL